eukprot:gene769-899_t
MVRFNENNAEFYFGQKKSWKCLRRSIDASDRRRYNCKYGKSLAGVITEHENRHNQEHIFSHFNAREANKVTNLQRAQTAPYRQPQRQPRKLKEEESEDEEINEWSLEGMAALQVAASEKRREKSKDIVEIKPDCDRMHDMIASRVRSDIALGKIYDNVWSRPGFRRPGTTSENFRSITAAVSSAPRDKSDHMTSQQSHEVSQSEEMAQKQMDGLNSGFLFPGVKMERHHRTIVWGEKFRILDEKIHKKQATESKLIAERKRLARVVKNNEQSNNNEHRPHTTLARARSAPSIGMRKRRQRPESRNGVAVGNAGARAAAEHAVPSSAPAHSLPSSLLPVKDAPTRQSLVAEAPWLSSWVKQYYNNDSLLMHQDVLHALNPKKWGLLKKCPSVPDVSFSGMGEDLQWTDSMQIMDAA